MTVQDDMIATLETYMGGLTGPNDGYPVIDLDVSYSSRSPIQVQLYISSAIRDEADDSPNGDIGYVLADRSVDDSSNTMGFIALTYHTNEESEKPYNVIGFAFTAPDYEVNARGGGEICDAPINQGWRADYFYVTYIGS